jgi:ribokinase
VIGSINMDLVVRTPRFAEPGETLSAHAWSAVAGGKGANQAVAAARLGARTTFCGRIGRDDFGTTLRSGLLEEGIDVEFLGVAQGRGTGIAMIAVDDLGRNSIYVVGGANHSLKAEDLGKFAPAIGRSGMLLLQLEIPLEVTLAAIGLAKELGVPVLLDPAPAPVGEVPEELLKVDLISPNETEAASLTGMTLDDLGQVKKAALELAKRGANQVVIKLGERGAVAMDRNGAAWHVPGAKVQVVDTTAAGDAFSAALAMALLKGNDLVSATQFACAAGAAAVGKAGAQPSMPTRAAVEEVLRQHDFVPRAL